MVYKKVMSEPQLSITIVTGGSKEMLRACLASLIVDNADVPAEIIVVDNATENGCVEMLRVEFPTLPVLLNAQRDGFAANQNRALCHSHGEYILLLNDDTVVRPGALRTLCRFLEQNPRVGAVGCRLENPDGSLQKSCYKFPAPARSLAENLLLVAAWPHHPWWGDYRAWPHDQVRAVDFVSGAALLVRRKVLDTTGYLDEGFFVYAEETDWCKRMRQDGWQVVFTPDATVIHYGGQSSAGMKDRQFVEFTRSQMRYIIKHHGRIGGAVYRCSMLLGAVLRLVAWGIASLARPAKRPVVQLWWRILRWHLGLGPHQGIRELAVGQNAAHISTSA